MTRASKAARSLRRVSRAAAWAVLLSWAGAALAFAATLAAQNQEVAAPAPTPAPSREAPHWAVRVAAFYKQENVAEAAERLKKAGFPVVTEEYMPGVGKTLTLLLAGPYPDRQTAEAAAAKLQGLNWPGYVQRYTPSPSAVAKAAAPAAAPRPAETKAETPPRPAPGPAAPEPAASEVAAAAGVFGARIGQMWIDEEAPHWAVRVAAFYKQDVAEGAERAERLKKAGFPVVTEEYMPGVGKSLTLLLVGPYPDRQAAEAAATKLQGLGWTGYVQRYTPSPAAVAKAAAPTPVPRPAETKAETPPRPAPGPAAPEPATSERVAVEVPAETKPAASERVAVEVPAETGPALSQHVEEEVLVVAKAPPPTPAEALAPARPPEGDSIPKGSLASAQSVPYGRVALFGNVTQLTRSDLSKSTVSQWSAALTLHSASNQNGGFEYGLDYRGSQYIASDRGNLNSLYNAYIGARTAGGAFGARIGQMWIDELGSLGAVGGVYLSLAQKEPTAIGRFRLGLFGGVDPKVQEVGYFDKVRKAGVFVALDGNEALRSVLGYVQVRNDNLLERSVVVLNNFIPIGRAISIYQAGEYDIAPPAGQGKSGLNYFLVNARWQASRVIELQALYHYGRSIDARTLTDDQINGRPIDPRLLEGFLFESAGGRLTFTVTPSVRLYAGYAAEKQNQSDTTIGRITAGLFAGDLFRSGFDLSVSENRYQRSPGAGNDNALYASLGRSIGPQVYLTAEYSTSVAFLQFTDAGGVTVVSQPSFQRYALSGVANLTRAFSLLVTLEHITGDLKEDEQSRALLGLNYRF